MEKQNMKRLFFGMEVLALWPDKLPHGRIIDESYRHVTLAFLGNINYDALESKMDDFPLPPFTVGTVGKFDSCLFLPPRHARVAAWHVRPLDEECPLLRYQREVTQWLIDVGFPPSHHERKWLPHVTVARSPFKIKEWEKAFSPMPCILKDIRLYESLGNLQYGTVWRYRLKAPYEEISHTADLAFHIRGATIEQIHIHAQAALSVYFPTMLNYFSTHAIASLEDIVIDLNRILSQADQEVGAPYKAISFHGDIMKEDDGTLHWEMIIDV